LIHDENDLGILASLPAKVDRQLLLSWQTRVAKPQDELILALVQVLEADGTVGDREKTKLAQAIRQHYKKHPDALELQAKGLKVPPTVTNHLS